MTIKYSGPKPIISHTGIEFDNNKEDKYVYINIVLQLLNALNHEYFEDKKYVYQADTSRFSEKILISEAKKYCPNLDTLIDKQNHNIEEEVAHQLKRAHENCVLDDNSKAVLEENINLMHDYLIQRSVNKAVYYCLIDALAELLKKDNIDYVITPMFQNYFHVLHSVQGSLKKQKFPIDTSLEIYKDKGELLVKLKVINKQ